MKTVAEQKALRKSITTLVDHTLRAMQQNVAARQWQEALVEANMAQITLLGAVLDQLDMVEQVLRDGPEAGR